MKPYVPEINSLSTLDQLDHIRMSPGERRMARATLRQAELLADMLMRVGAGLRHVVAFVGRGIGVFARCSQMPPVTQNRAEWRLP